MTQLLNLESLRTAIRHEVPFQWVFVESAFRSQEIAQQLGSTFPNEGFERYIDYKRRAMARRGKTLSNTQLHEQEQDVRIRTLVELGSDKTESLQDLTVPWKIVIEDLLSLEYREAVTLISGVDVQTLPMKVEVWRHNSGSQLTPHTDRRNKVLTYLFYFNEDWRPECGGCFRVLNSNNHDDYHVEIPPLLNTSLLLVRSDTSWHSVTPVTETCSLSRKVLQAWFWRD